MQSDKQLRSTLTLMDRVANSVRPSRSGDTVATECVCVCVCVRVCGCFTSSEVSVSLSTMFSDVAEHGLGGFKPPQPQTDFWTFLKVGFNTE